MSDSDIAARLETLETKVSFQDDSLEKLNAVITDQWAQIDRLSRQVAELLDRLREAESRAPAPSGDELPPHY